MSQKLLYTPQRLADVLALIQILALDPQTHRSLEGVTAELQGAPRSSKSWLTIASEHPEFFRVKEASEHPLSLLARHVIPRDDSGSRPFPPDMAYRLLQTAIDLYDREASSERRWDQLRAVLVGAVIGLVPSLVALWISLQHVNCPGK